MRSGNLVCNDYSSSRTVISSDRTVVRVNHLRVQERFRAVCTTRHQHISRFVQITDSYAGLPQSQAQARAQHQAQAQPQSQSQFRKHVTTIRFPPKLDRPQVSSTGMETVHTKEQTYIQAPSYVQTQNYATPTTTSMYVRTSPNNSGYVSVSQPLHKKGSLRNGDVLKRSRVQATYELSQDILDKQIEVLERKYGGVKARNAALTIQRAFRRYTLRKKFAAITAMAKAEKRISRRINNVDETRSIAGEGDNCDQEYRNFDNDRDYGTLRAIPTRSMSLRERRSIDNISIPRSQSGSTTICWESTAGHSGHSTHSQHYYSASEVKHQLHSLQPSVSSACSADLNRSRSSLNSSTGSGSGGCGGGRKVPPEVPKRTSSISAKSMEPRYNRSSELSRCAENGSLSSVQSSGSDSSISADRLQCEFAGSPVWKHKVRMAEYADPTLDASLGNISNSSTATFILDRSEQPPTASSFKISETVRKRQYRVGLNLFNKKPEKGILYLIRKGFLENTPQGVARFLISRKGLSKQMIGEYLGNLQNPFCMAVLECFAMELDLSGMQVDVALRKFQQHFRMPGEAQKIERLMEVFSQRYCQCNIDIVARLRSPDTVFVLAFAIIMLNTDLHTPNIKPERRMRLEDFIKNLRGIDDCGDIDSDMLAGIYERVKANEFKPGSDHVTQVMKVQATIVGKKPNMALPHRRLVCYCRLYEIPDINKKERPGVHQREVFLFNDLLVITKILSKKKSSVTYTFRNSFPLCGMVVTLFEVPYYSYGIRLSQRVGDKVLITFNARNEHDRCKFAEDLKESVCEMDEMENLRIEAELERQKSCRSNRSGSENRDSGVADVEVYSCQYQCAQGQGHGHGHGHGPGHGHANDGLSDDLGQESQIKRSALSNSLLDLHEQFTGEKAQRRGSVGSLDSGMSVSFQSTSASTCSRSDKMPNKGKPVHYQHSFLGGLFNKKQSQSPGVSAKSTEV